MGRTRSKTMRSLALTLALLANPLAVASAPKAAAEISEIAPRGIAYAALGDSYSSGEGAGDYSAESDIPMNHCHRSNNSYPELLSQEFVLGPVQFAACSGAVTKDLFKANGTNKSEGPQLETIAGGTGIVTLTIGGNDLGFADVLSDCTYATDLVLGGRINLHGSPGCKSRQKAAVEKRLRQFSIDDTSRNPGIYKLIDILAELKLRSPKVTIYVAGYPRLFGRNLADRCAVGIAKGLVDDPVPVYVSKDDANWINSTVDKLNAVIRDSVDEANLRGQTVYYVDPNVNGFQDHARCSTKTPWINPIIFNQVPKNDPSAESFHPNVDGQKAYAKAFRTQIEETIPPSINVEPFEAIIGQEYSNYFQVAGGTAAQWEVLGALPPGLSLDSEYYVRGVPTQTGRWRVTVRVTDSNGLTDEATVDIWVRDKIEPGTVVMRSNGLKDVVDLECATAVDCTAFGQGGHLSHWDGQEWSAPVASPTMNSSGSASCSDYRWCVIVDGESVKTTSDLTNWKTVAGGSWSSVYCLSRIACLLTGNLDPNAGEVKAYLLNRDLLTVLPGGAAQSGYLSTLTCVSKKFCAGASPTGRLATLRAPLADFNGSWSSVERGGWSPQSFQNVFCASAKSCIAGDNSGGATFWNGVAWGATVNVSPWFGASLIGAGCSNTDKSCWLMTSDGRFFWKAPPAKGSDTSRWSTWGTVATRLPSQGYFSATFCDSGYNCVATTQDGDAYSFNAGSAWDLTGPGYPVELPGDFEVGD